ncbi:MAG: hypothetical protein GTO17_08245 [Candidatus Aminicenantes bacterium]|nr:hypothetical protein [Candidatus Aminicenantes bacterium]
MNKKIRLSLFRNHHPAPGRQKGVGLIVIFLVLAFLQIIGFALLMVTSTGTRMAGNIRTQQQASNAAESGFNNSWVSIEDSFADGDWISFDGHYVIEPTGIDNPQADNYFRKLTDLEILNVLDTDSDGTPDVDNVLYFRQPFIPTGSGTYNLLHTYTVFLIDDEAGGGTADPNDALLVCIGAVGSGNNVTTTRLEIELVIRTEGST